MKNINIAFLVVSIKEKFILWLESYNMNKATKQDIEATIKILKGRFGKFYSFLLLWYPFMGSVIDHIRYLENKLRDDLRLIDIIPKECFVIESCACGLVIGVKKDILGTGVEP